MFTSYWWLMGLVVLAVIVLFKRFQSSEAGGRKLDEWRMKLPVFGKVVQINLFGQFARTLGTLLQNGVPVLTALKITEQVMSNQLIREAIAKTREAVTDGKTLAQPLAQSKLFPQLMIDLVRIGEETGDVPGALNNIADTYENELQIALARDERFDRAGADHRHGHRRGLFAVEHFSAAVPDDRFHPLNEIAELRISQREARGASCARRISPAPKASSLSRAAFTLIEIMIVVGIIGLVAAMGLPSITKALQKEGMRKAVSDVQDVFFSAREQAILNNQKVAVVFYPRDRRFGVEGAASGRKRS